MSRQHFNDYEKLLIETALNTGEKIINAGVLYNTKHAYRESFFLLIISQEELAKFILLPFANAAGKIDELTDINKHQGPYFNHRVKQKIFTSFGLQNRNHKDIEYVKQGCLYTGRDKKGRIARYAVKPEKTHEELCRAVRLYIQLIVHNLEFAPSSQVSPKARKLINWFTNNVFIPALKDSAPQVIEDAKTYVLKKNAKGVKALRALQTRTLLDADLHEFLATNPFVFVDMLAYVLTPEQHRRYFSEINGMTIEEMLDKLNGYIS